ncbi:cysteine--1-D-myo-inosityl 2-amino-2-deoxy-alpha-D-glucopyranoside ligase [Arthrobacter sp. zg-Y859]|uniref:L-cysteine:1D-myo-inositol 2-amino-2-deoxy-alpha-D-glucopyranoside ligase n=1 Tax=Arthrobacter jinronghuae TaxID=2964609 RepID=A0ABT1NR46_9MICC|nr:cysteine--1-D-myo-inosityl 2-amino-2-deoxy-alpha-D-glucopyranoside ligase [Arthrobacter jinronghuae]MCQ1950211.1 cysteine--1-D-myo-inosityl 2-amino-2-deoxy-alpha-D-glucopyranoside ligase [Arthrobacter jinronghuae]UWX77195.1 cysteine--1-D-myo-inosityl 2-amino-2-deoxy-alpha-D-glucopyranoside ligase [Arthrobacter jinronghuae]
MIAWKSSSLPSLPGKSDDVRLYDTAAQARVTVRPGGDASMYVCGITPYDATHMGHASTYVAFDLLNRQWRDAGHTVRYVQNVTDVDDPLLERANATGADWRQLAQEQTQLFRDDMEALNVLAPDHYIGAVEAVEWIVPVVEDLMDRGLAYRVSGNGGEPDGDLYFDVDAASRLAEGDPDAWWLGQVSHLTREQMLPVFAERGGDPERPGKRNALDPLLWRMARTGEPSWDGGRLGTGRPGWHIECSVIAQRFLPRPFTVQAGGSDLVFPHHEMSAGHAFACEGTPLASHYAHAGMVGFDGEKMSKSLGNLVLVSRLRAEGVEPAAIRLVLLSHHYRTDWFWTSDQLRRAEERLVAWRKALQFTNDDDAAALVQQIRAALADDLDAPAALQAVDAWAGAAVRGETKGSQAGAELVCSALNALLGLQL